VDREVFTLLSLFAYLIIFGGHKTKSFAGGKVRGMDVGNWRFVEQNPNTKSRWAERARNGEKIMWVIHKPTNKYAARVVEGRFEAL